MRATAEGITECVVRWRAQVLTGRGGGGGFSIQNRRGIRRRYSSQRRVIPTLLNSTAAAVLFAELRKHVWPKESVVGRQQRCSPGSRRCGCCYFIGRDFRRHHVTRAAFSFPRQQRVVHPEQVQHRRHLFSRSSHCTSVDRRTAGAGRVFSLLSLVIPGVLLPQEVRYCPLFPSRQECNLLMVSTSPSGRTRTSTCVFTVAVVQVGDANVHARRRCCCRAITAYPWSRPLSRSHANPLLFRVLWHAFT